MDLGETDWEMMVGLGQGWAYGYDFYVEHGCSAAKIGQQRVEDTGEKWPQSGGHHRRRLEERTKEADGLAVWTAILPGEPRIGINQRKTDRR